MRIGYLGDLSCSMNVASMVIIVFIDAGTSNIACLKLTANAVG